MDGDNEPGKLVRIGRFSYDEDHLKKDPQYNCIGKTRMNVKTGEWEWYNPHDSGPWSNR